MISEEEFKCLSCKTFAQEAMETLCCFTVLCRSCSGALDACPSCTTEEFKARTSGLARRIIASLPATCQACEHKTIFSEIEKHYAVCPNRAMRCKDPKCEFEGKLQDFVQHVKEKHKRELLMRFENGTPLAN